MDQDIKAHDGLGGGHDRLKGGGDGGDRVRWGGDRRTHLLFQYNKPNAISDQFGYMRLHKRLCQSKSNPKLQHMGHSFAISKIHQ